MKKLASHTILLVTCGKLMMLLFIIFPLYESSLEPVLFSSSLNDPVCLTTLSMGHFCRMYQALLASGDQTSAKVLLEKIPKDDAHVCYVIKECESVYVASSSVNKKKGRHKKKMLKMSRNGREV